MIRVWHSPRYTLELPGCAFRTDKFARTARALVEEGTIRAADVAEPEPASRALLGLAHDEAWIEKALAGAWEPWDLELLELPAAPGLAEAHRRCAQGTVEACRDALDHGLGLHAGGGSHHAFRDHGEGFCVFNDLAIAALWAARERGVRAAVVDLDAHQGNGTAAILAGHAQTATFSMHAAAGYPDRRVPGDRDVELADGTGDETYLDALRRSLPDFLDAAEPGLAIYQAGVDGFRGDSLGRLALSAEGLAERDAFVLAECRERGVPVAVTLGGGYGADAADTVQLHAQTLRIAVKSFRERLPA